MVVKASVRGLKEVDLRRLLGGNLVYVGYPEESSRTDSELTNAQIAFLNTKGTRPLKHSKKIKENMEIGGASYSQALNAYLRSHGDIRWHIPPRPFIEPAIENNLTSIMRMIKTIAIKNIEKEDISSDLDKLGLRAVNSIRRFMRNYPDNQLTPNANSTIKNKGIDHPLIGKTGELIRGVTYVKESN